MRSERESHWTLCAHWRKYRANYEYYAHGDLWAKETRVKTGPAELRELREESKRLRNNLHCQQNGVRWANTGAH